MTMRAGGNVSSLARPEQTHRPYLTGEDDAIALCLAVLLFAVYLFTYRGGFHSIDEVSMFSVTESIAKRGAFDTNQVAWSQWTTSQSEAQGFFGQDGNVYSKKGLALSLFAAPLYWLALQVPGLGMLQVTSLLNAIITALTGGILYLYVRRLGYSAPASAVLGLLFGLATSSWVYARYLFSEPVAAWLLLTAAFLLLGFKQDRRWTFLIGAGLAAGLAVTARANNLLCAPLCGLYLLAALAEKDERNRWRLRRGWLGRLLIFGGAVALAGSVMGMFNWVRAGNALQTGYDLAIFSPALWAGLAKLLFSPLRGLFWFSPILLLAPVAFAGFYRRHRTEAALAAAIVLANVLLFSAWTSGEGLSWGSRFLIPVLAFIVLPLVAPLQQIADGQKSLWLAAFILLGGLSVIIQILGVLVNPWLHFSSLHALFQAEFLENTPALYTPRYSPIWGQVQQLLTWDLAKSDVAWLQPWGIETGIAITLLLLIAAGGLGLAHLLRARNLTQTRLTVIPLALIALAGSIALSTMGHYFERDQQFGQPDDALHRILERVASEEHPGDSIVTLMPYHYHVPMNFFRARLPVYGFSRMPPPLPPEGDTLLQNAVRDHDRIWLITHGVRPGEPPNEVERWLAGHAFKATDDWHDDFRLCLYASPPDAAPAGSMEGSGAEFGGAIRLDSYASGPSSARPGEIIPLAFEWQPLVEDLHEYKVFIHLVATDGTLAAQRDSAPVDGFAPTQTWAAGDTIRDLHGLLLPPDVEAGRYAIWAGWYDTVTGERLPVTRPDGSTGDHLVLGALEVE